MFKKTNLFYKWLLDDLWYIVDLEFCLKSYSYDLKIWDILIEINPYAFHNSTRAPRDATPKSKTYHYDKAKQAVDNWYKIIEVRDRTTKENLLEILENLKETKLGSPALHWYNPKTKDHLMDDWYARIEMLWNWYLEIYDWWEKYIFNQWNR